MTKRRKIQLAAEKRFIKLLDKAISEAYLAGIENRGDVLSLPLVDLHRRLTAGTPAVQGRDLWL